MKWKHPIKKVKPYWWSKSNGKRISSIRHTSEEKNPKKPSENTTFLKYGIFRWFFGFFSSLVCRIELILSPMLLHFSPDSVWYPYIKFTTTFFFGQCHHKTEEKNNFCLKCHPYEKLYFWVVFWIFLLTGKPDWALVFFIGFVFFSW